MFEKLMNSKINEIADWIIRLIMLNVMIIFFSLGIVTIYPAISAGYNMFHDYTNKKNPRLFVDYFKYFKESLGRKIILELIFAAGFFLAYLNIRYYDLSLQNAQSTFYLIGYYISLGLIAILFAITLFSFIVLNVKSDISYKQLFKMSFFLAGKYYFITLLLVIITFSPALLILYPNSFTALAFIAIGISLPLLLNVMITNRVVRYLERLGENHG
jgi:uncharacterized membrane protein YesL